MPAREAVGDAEFAGLMAPLGPFAPAPRLAVGVSGGPDSLATFLLAHRWAVARGGSTLALVADHGLRPESASEAAAVASRLRMRGYEVRLLSLALSSGPALHERARRARLAALEAAAAEAGAPWLLLGHHRRDQAETLLFRLLRGSGEAGLSAMAPARAMPGVMVLRPLLDMPVARLEATVAEAGLEPVRDPSNDDPRFARARLRAALADPSGDGAGTRALVLAAGAFARRRARDEAAVAERLALAAEFRPEGWVRLDAAALGCDAVARRALSRLLRGVSGQPHPPPRKGVERLLMQGGGTLGGALWRGRVLCREPAACAPPVAAVAGAVWDGRWHLDRDVPGAMLGALGEGRSGMARAARAGLPDAVLRGCPVLRRADGEAELLPEGLSLRPLGGAPI